MMDAVSVKKLTARLSVQGRVIALRHLHNAACKIIVKKQIIVIIMSAIAVQALQW